VLAVLMLLAGELAAKVREEAPHFES